MAGRNFTYNINESTLVEGLGDGLSSSYRLKILSLLVEKSYSVQDLLKKLDISPSTLSFHLKILKEANLIKYVNNPSKRGNEKNVSLNVENITISFIQPAKKQNVHYFENIPIGSFSNFEIKSPCLIATKNNVINPIDSVNVFSSYHRTEAQLISFSTGTIEYCILLNEIHKSKISEISFSQEICSECPNYNNSWKSTITFWLNDVEIGSYLSLGDYGGRKGNYSPAWWPVESSNYGNLVVVTVNKEGTFINGVKINDISVDKLNLDKNEFLRYKIGVKPTSKYAGGINIFGRSFGDFEQDIVFSYTVKS